MKQGRQRPQTILGLLKHQITEEAGLKQSNVDAVCVCVCWCV